MEPNISGHISTLLGTWLRNSKRRNVSFERITAGTSAWSADGDGGWS